MKTYQRMTNSLLDEIDDHQLFQNVYEHLVALLGDEWREESPEKTGFSTLSTKSWELQIVG